MPETWLCPKVQLKVFATLSDIIRIFTTEPDRGSYRQVLVRERVRSEAGSLAVSPMLV